MAASVTSLFLSLLLSHQLNHYPSIEDAKGASSSRLWESRWDGRMGGGAYLKLENILDGVKLLLVAVGKGAG